MRSSHYLMLAIIFSITSLQSIHAEGVFKWKDARGNIQYGDEPPANARLDNFKMPEIMVIDGFKEQWKPLGNQPKAIAVKKQPVQAPVVTLEKPSIYTKLMFIAPKDNQIIKSGFGGEVSAMLSIKPPLKKGHKIVFELDGKVVAKSKSRINNFSNLSGGSHAVTAKIVDRGGNVLKTSSAVSFRVVRTKANKKRAGK
ncbi:MAG: DUF4124 domain-containing protein [Cocleimonas sp.]